jgi:hypothetical protein
MPSATRYTASEEPSFGSKVVARRLTLEEHMLSKTIAMALLSTALMTGVASAQSTSNKWDTASVTKMQREGDWRVSKLVGVNVYNEIQREDWRRKRRDFEQVRERH